MKQKTPNIVPVLILTLVTAITWVFFSIYLALTAKPNPTVPDNITQQLDPSIDQKTVDSIKAKLFLDESQIPTNTFSVPAAGASPVSSPKPEATSVATPIASPSGTIVPQQP
jgi:hypothetical protein